MPERISPADFEASAGTAGWHVVGDAAVATFRTGSFARGVELVDAIGLLADEANHHPDVDLRYRDVTVRLRTHDVDGLSQRDVDLARVIADAARALGIEY